ncbi:MAG: hypothetical protein CVV33_04405, partial [Methanomicrobiales archaeon HGW-Methanomicrobiales-4]
SDLRTFLEHCRLEHLTAPALENGMVFCIPREYSLAGLSWILVLEFLVNILHRNQHLYNLKKEEAGLMAILSNLIS